MKKIYKRIFASIALFSIELIAVWVVFLASFLIFLYVSREIFLNKDENFDQEAFELLHQLISPAFTTWMKWITFMASWEFVLVLSLSIFVYFLFIKRHHWYSIKIPAVALGSISFNVLLKNLFDRPRPFLPHLVEASGLSYPSGHAMVSFSFYGLLIYIVWEKVENKWLRWTLCIALLILIHLIGFSRVYLRVHYASDVMAGFALGIIWLILTLFILKKIEKFSSQKVKNIPDFPKAE